MSSEIRWTLNRDLKEPNTSTIFIIRGIFLRPERRITFETTESSSSRRWTFSFPFCRSVFVIRAFGLFEDTYQRWRSVFLLFRIIFLIGGLLICNCRIFVAESNRQWNNYHLENSWTRKPNDYELASLSTWNSSSYQLVNFWYCKSNNYRSRNSSSSQITIGREIFGRN